MYFHYLRSEGECLVWSSLWLDLSWNYYAVYVRLCLTFSCCVISILEQQNSNCIMFFLIILHLNKAVSLLLKYFRSKVIFLTHKDYISFTGYKCNLSLTLESF